MNEIWSDKQKKQQLVYSYVTFVLNGMLALSIGSLMPLIRDARGLDYALCGLLVSLHSVGNFLSSFFAGTFAMLLGRKKSILIFNAFFAIAFLLIILSDNRWCLITAFFMTGLARGATSNFCNMTINNLAPGKAGVINGLHAMFSIGAFLFPILLTVMTANKAENWLVAGYFMLAMGIVSWLLYLLTPVDEGIIAKKEQKKSTFGFFKEPMFLLCTATLFFYLCVEQGVIGWMVTYFKDTGLLDPALSQMMASIQWIMILAGRLTTVGLSGKVKKSTLLRIMGAGLVLFFIILMTGTTTPQIVIGIMGFGYSMAGIYPTTISFAGKTIQKYPISWSFMLTMASIGSIVMPSIIGKIAEVSGIVYGMSSIVAVVIIDMVFITCLTTYVNRKKIEE
ncbi:MAG: MFS transporter [Lachnospiraceae bacterium]|nr:MFS transporter [Lachnospiraceae bacterium]